MSDQGPPPEGPEDGQGPPPPPPPPSGPESGSPPPEPPSGSWVATPGPAPYPGGSDDASPRGDRTRDLRPMQLGEMLDRAIRLYQQHFVLLISVVAVIIVPWTLLTYAMAQTGGIVAAVVGGAGGTLIIQPVVSGAIAKTAGDVYLGRDASVGSTYSYLGTRLGAVIAVSLLTTLALLLGFILLVIPGIIAMVRLFAAVQALVLENLGATDAMRRSWGLVKGSSWRVLGYLILVGLLVGVAGLILALPFAFADSTAVLLLGDVLTSVLLTPITAVFGVLLYFDLRIRKEAFDLEVMARELG